MKSVKVLIFTILVISWSSFALQFSKDTVYEGDSYTTDTVYLYHNFTDTTQISITCSIKDSAKFSQYEINFWDNNYNDITLGEMPGYKYNETTYSISDSQNILIHQFQIDKCIFCPLSKGQGVRDEVISDTIVANIVVSNRTESDTLTLIGDWHDWAGAVETVAKSKTVTSLNIGPNPFNPITGISYNLTKLSNVLLEVYNVDGKLVDRLIQEKENKGQHIVYWNASKKSSGAYYFKLSVDGHVQTSKGMLLK